MAGGKAALEERAPGCSHSMPISGELVPGSNVDHPAGHLFVGAEVLDLHSLAKEYEFPKFDPGGVGVADERAGAFGNGSAYAAGQQ